MDNLSSPPGYGDRPAEQVLADESEEMIRCGTHGVVGKAFVCQHLAQRLRDKGPPIGFFVPDQQDEKQPAAWCNACDEMLATEGEWNDVSEGFAGVTLICRQCFASLEQDQPFE